MAALDTSRTHFGSLTSAGRIGSTFTSMFGLNNVSDTTRANVVSVDLNHRLGAVFASLSGSFRAWNDARNTRNALNRLSDLELNDIGLSRGDIDKVAHGKAIR